MRIAPEITGASVVFIGNFNPSIFTPAWFGWHKLLPQGTVDVSELQIAQPQITAFKADWLELQIVPDRFSISTGQEPFVRLKDLAVRVFREELPHTPLQSLGINRRVHFLVNNLDERDRIGRQLAPIEPWGDWSRLLGPNGRNGGMTSLTMTQSKVQGRSPAGRINVTVEPSTKVGQNETGVYVQVNDHYSIDDPTSRNATNELAAILEKRFDESLCHAEQIIDQIMSLRDR